VTKKIESILTRYGVRLRTGDQKVTHQVYGFTTVVTAEQFAVFEVALKSAFINWAGHFLLKGDRAALAEVLGMYTRLFRMNNIAPPRSTRSRGTATTGWGLDGRADRGAGPAGSPGVRPMATGGERSGRR
jgi:hypothetical protein